MEKFYMEELKNKKKSVMNTSVVLSFAVSIFAVFSLAMFGIVMNQGTGISYAAPDANGEVKVTDTDQVSVCIGDSNGCDDKPMMQVNAYYTATTKKLTERVFCIERANKTALNDTYVESDAVRSGKKDVRDAGLIYLLSLGQSGLGQLSTGNKDVDGLIIQSAIWYYLNEKTSSDLADQVDVYKLNHQTDSGGNKWFDKEFIEYPLASGEHVYIDYGSGQFEDITQYSITGQNGKIMKLVGQARNAKAPSVSISIGEGEATKTEDKKYYQSPLITVVGDPADLFEKYSVSIEGIDDMKVVNENGEEISRSDITAGTKFYVRIPEGKVTMDKGTQTVQINVFADFTGGSATYLVSKTHDTDTAAGNQRLAYVSPASIITGAEFVVSPDTGMNVAQTIYFVGLIVLLCGVGIVYANAKPVEQKQ